MANREVLPEGWTVPKGYANGVVTGIGETVYLGGQIGWNSELIFECHNFIGQAEQTLRNIRDILEAAGMGPENMVRMTWYILSRDDYLENLRPLGKVYRNILGKHYPAMSVVQVVALMESEALLEIEVTAARAQNDNE